jgi:hypothetical protein
MGRYRALGLLNNFALLVSLVALGASRSLAVTILRVLPSTCLSVSFEDVALVVDVILLEGL